jgi:hypothetical protein
LRPLIGTPGKGEAARQQKRRSRGAGQGRREGPEQGEGNADPSSKGLSMDRAVVDNGSDVFAHSQAYVALSRVHSWEGVLLSNFTEAKIDRPSVFREYDRFLSMKWTHGKFLRLSEIGTGCH